jgi:hypothetical protein
MLPAWVKRLLALKSLAIGAGVVVLLVLHRIPVDTATGILAGLGGIWSGVAGTLKVGAQATAAQPAPGGSTATPAPVAPAPSTPPPPEGSNLGPEHGAPS